MTMVMDTGTCDYGDGYRSVTMVMDQVPVIMVMVTGTCDYGDGYRYLWLGFPSGPEGLWSQGYARAGAAPACHNICSISPMHKL